MKKISEKRSVKGIALSQIIIFILGVVAISYALGSEIKEVEAQIPTGTGPGLIPFAAGDIGAGIPNAGGTFFQNFFRGFLKNIFRGGAEKGGGEVTRQLSEKAASSVQGAGAFLSNLIIAYGTYAAILVILKIAGASERNIRNMAISGAISTTAIVIAAAFLGPPGWVVALLTAGAMAIWGVLTFQKYSREIFTYQPSLWQPADGGQRCEKCNAFAYGCTEYLCHSYGRACILANQGTEFETCLWNNPLDRTPPIMDAMESVLLDDWVYVDSGVVLPPDLGVKINNPPNTAPNVEGCVPPYSSVVIGVNTSEPAECRIDRERRANYADLISYLEQSSSLTYNHTLTLPNSATPSAEAMAEVGWDIENGRHYEFYIRCKDANGNIAPANFIVEFCVDPSPDRAAPQIIGTNYLDPAYITYEQEIAELEVYTDEPATCRWDHEDVDYDSMVGEDMNISCSQRLGNYKFDNYIYGCKGNLTGLNDNTDNIFYIRCNDKPWLGEIKDAGETGDRYKSPASERLTLKGTSPIAITSVKVNGQESNILVKGSDSPVKIKIEVETLGGAEDGLARCKYIIGGTKYDFYNDGNPDYLPKNIQNLWLPAGHYEYGIECSDRGGNPDTQQISFDIEIDDVAPIVVRLYYETPNLRITTNEPAECVYDTSSAYDSTKCSYNFAEGLPMSTTDDLNHATEASTRSVYYIKCRDKYINQPLPNACTIIARPI